MASGNSAGDFAALVVVFHPVKSLYTGSILTLSSEKEFLSFLFRLFYKQYIPTVL